MSTGSIRTRTGNALRALRTPWASCSAVASAAAPDRGTRTSVDPVSFEANLVSGNQFYPYGYSDIVPIRFGS